MDNPQKRYKKYLDFKEKHQKYWGEKGDWKKGEIEILDDVSLFSKCEDGSTSIMVGLGEKEEDARKRSLIGIRDENRWGVVVAEPVKTPSGDLGIFVRFISWGQINEGKAGLVIAPILSDGRFVFIKTFRNATRSWCLEFSRGMKDLGKKIEDLIEEELSLETGGVVLEKPIKIGELEPDDGSMYARVDIYKVVVEIKGEIKQETMEAIDGIAILDKSEVKKAVKKQEYESDGKKYQFVDAFTLSALQLLDI